MSQLKLRRRLAVWAVTTPNGLAIKGRNVERSIRASLETEVASKRARRHPRFDPGDAIKASSSWSYIEVVHWDALTGPSTSDKRVG